MHSQPSERVAVVGTVDPQTVANSEKLTDAVDMQKSRGKSSIPEP